jgi:hypothetical protein
MRDNRLGKQGYRLQWRLRASGVDCTQLKSRMIDELKRTWKEAVVAYSKYCQGIFVVD